MRRYAQQRYRGVTHTQTVPVDSTHEHTHASMAASREGTPVMLPKDPSSCIIPPCHTSPPPLPSPGNHYSALCQRDPPARFRRSCQWQWIHRVRTPCTWLLHLSIIISRFIHAHVFHSPLLSGSIPLHRPPTDCLSTDWFLTICFLFGAILDKCARNTHVQDLVSIYAFFSPEETPRSGVAGYVLHILTF